MARVNQEEKGNCALFVNLQINKIEKKTKFIFSLHNKEKKKKDKNQIKKKSPTRLVIIVNILLLNLLLL